VPIIQIEHSKLPVSYCCTQAKLFLEKESRFLFYNDTQHHHQYKSNTIGRIVKTVKLGNQNR